MNTIEVIFARLSDKTKEVYDPLVHGVEKPGVVVYQLTTITREQWEWILSHPDPREAIHRFFPNL